MKRNIIVINKNWEADAALTAILNPDFHADLPDVLKGFWKAMLKDYFANIKLGDCDFPHTREQGDSRPSAIFKKGDTQLELWCLNNIMTPAPAGADTYYYSYSGQKAKDLVKIIDYSTDPINFVAAFGTAGVPSEVTKNGSVVIGSGIFPYNAGKAAKEWAFDCPDFGKLVNSSVSNDLFDKINIGVNSIALKQYFETSTLTPPQNPSNVFQIIADKNIVAVGDMNTSSYLDFGTNDKAALNQFNNFKKTNSLDLSAYSIETTHGIIREVLRCENFIFISAITDRYRYFDGEVTPKVRAQNFSAAFNGGVFLNWFIPFCLNDFQILK